jgi:hypothetical protein
LSKFLSLLLCSCALLKAPPPAAEDATCIGIAGFATGLDLASQAGDRTIPRIDIDLSECIDIDIANTCEEEAWLRWSTQGAEALAFAAHNEVARVIIPAVGIAECHE